MPRVVAKGGRREGAKGTGPWVWVWSVSFGLIGVQLVAVSSVCGKPWVFRSLCPSSQGEVFHVGFPRLTLLAHCNSMALITVGRRALHYSQYRLLCGTNIAHNNALTEHFHTFHERIGSKQRTCT